MVDQPSNTNGKVTLAVIQNELAHLKHAIEERSDEDRRERAEIKQELKYLSTQIVQISNDLLKRITELEKSDSQRAERWTAHKEEHARENRLMMVISWIGSIIASILGITVKTP